MFIDDLFMDFDAGDDDELSYFIEDSGIYSTSNDAETIIEDNIEDEYVFNDKNIQEAKEWVNIITLLLMFATKVLF